MGMRITVFRKYELNKILNINLNLTKRINWSRMNIKMIHSRKHTLYEALRFY